MSLIIYDGGNGIDIKSRILPISLTSKNYQTVKVNAYPTKIDFEILDGNTNIFYCGFTGNFDKFYNSVKPTNLSELLTRNDILAERFEITDTDLASKKYYNEIIISNKNISISDFISLLTGSSNNFISATSENDIYYENLNVNSEQTNGSNSPSTVVYLGDGDDKYYHIHPKLNIQDFYDGGSGNDLIILERISKRFIIEFKKYINTNTKQFIETTDGLFITDKLIELNDIQINQVEKIQFTDLTIDTTSLTKTAALQNNDIVNLVELYIASFNRAPDSVGLDYWGGRLSDGMSLQDIAKSFFVQPETVAAYPTTMATSDFVTKVYNNVLSRGPDKGGLDYWVGELNTGHVTKDSFLLAIINGAMAASGSAVDRQTLANKESVGAYYALTQGLNNSTTWAKDVMSAVTDQMATVTAANAKTDGYAAIATNPATSDLVVKLVGVY